MAPRWAPPAPAPPPPGATRAPSPPPRQCPPTPLPSSTPPPPPTSSSPPPSRSIPSSYSTLHIFHPPPTLLHTPSSPPSSRLDQGGEDGSVNTLRRELANKVVWCGRA